MAFSLPPSTSDEQSPYKVKETSLKLAMANKAQDLSGQVTMDEYPFAVGGTMQHIL